MTGERERSHAADRARPGEPHSGEPAPGTENVAVPRRHRALDVPPDGADPRAADPRACVPAAQRLSGDATTARPQGRGWRRWRAAPYRAVAHHFKGSKDDDGQSEDDRTRRHTMRNASCGVPALPRAQAGRLLLVLCLRLRLRGRGQGQAEAEARGDLRPDAAGSGTRPLWPFAVRVGERGRCVGRRRVRVVARPHADRALV